MSEENQQADLGTGETAPNAPSELEVLKARAKLMGINFSNNIGLESLKSKVNAKMDGEPEAPEVAEVMEPEAEVQLNPLDGDVAGQVPKAKLTKNELRTRMREECLALIRVRIQNLDPKKADLPGEIFCVGNEIIGTVRKYIPYGEITDNGYHIPKILFDELNSRKFQNIKTRKKAGQITVETNWAKEFAMEVLPPLTQEELDNLAISQQASGSVGNNSGLS